MSSLNPTFTKKELSPSELELIITVSVNEMEGFFQEAAADLSQNLKISGFRPGKAPLEIIEEICGSEKLFSEAANLAVRRTLPKVIGENKIEAIGRPRIQILKIAKKNNFEYKAEITILPKVELPDYKKIVSKISRKSVEINDKEVDDALRFLRKSRAKFVTVKRAAQSGDRVEIDFSMSVDGIKIEHGESKNHPLIIGENLFFKDFEEKLAGLKEGETKEFQIKFPGDYYDKKLAGRAADFRVKMNLVQETELPEENDDFAKHLDVFSPLEGDHRNAAAANKNRISEGDGQGRQHSAFLTGFADLKSLRKSIKEGLLEEKNMKENERWQREVLEKIASTLDMSIPQLLVDAELNGIVENLKHNMESSGLKFDDYLKHIGKTIEDLKKENAKEAEKIVKIGLAIKAIAEKEKITVSEREIKDRIDRELLKYRESIKEAKKNLDLSRVKDYYYGIIRNEKTINLLKKFLVD